MLFMLSLRRHPAAVISCQSAIESALKAHLRAKPGALVNVASAITGLAGQGKPRLVEFSTFRVLGFTNLRNDFAHYGYSPKDDSRAISQLLGTGLPLLLALYADLFDLFLDARAVRPEAQSFESLTDVERDKVGLIPEIGDHVRHALDVYALVKDQPGLDVTYCIHALAYQVGRSVSANFMSAAECDLAFGDRRFDRSFDAEETERKRLESLFTDSWRFDCPICQEGVSGFVCEIVERPDVPHRFSVPRGACPSCGFSIPASYTHLADVLLAKQVTAAAAAMAARQ
jgi:hypothetical protein